MNSPFPGMDPYLEPHWADVHTVLTAYTRDHLNAVLPPDLVARTEERVAIEPQDAPARIIAPDVRVIEPPPASAAGESPAAVAVAEPVILMAQVEAATERFVRIVEAGTEKLITVIEFLSATNKRPGEGLRDYVGKRRDLLAAGVHLVEVDLVRDGNWQTLLRPFIVARKYQTLYRVTVHRADEPGKVELYPITLRQALPVMSIPLRPGDAVVALDLQALVRQAYANGRYDRTDYTGACDPPLTSDDAAWADELLKGLKLR